MKTITTREHDLIASVIGEGLTALAEAVIEKDLLVTEVLRKLTEFGRRVERRPRCANLHNGASHAAVSAGAQICACSGWPTEL